ncbi:UNVERIFIED_CONTAM: hypothetical protein K2H54_008346 [Gekko kuhli]
MCLEKAPSPDIHRRSPLQLPDLRSQLSILNINLRQSRLTPACTLILFHLISQYLTTFLRISVFVPLSRSVRPTNPAPLKDFLNPSLPGSRGQERHRPHKLKVRPSIKPTTFRTQRSHLF